MDDIFMLQSDKSILKGLHNYFETSALPNVLKPGRNSPKKVPYGLYAEQVSGTALLRRVM
jgi:homogentisate 1,2-dioxygenase